MPSNGRSVTPDASEHLHRTRMEKDSFHRAQTTEVPEAVQDVEHMDFQNNMRL
jgi:hypothetical protein